MARQPALLQAVAREEGAGTPAGLCAGLSPLTRFAPSVRVSALALVKMTMHCKAGGNLEARGRAGVRRWPAGEQKSVREPRPCSPPARAR